MAEVHCNPGTPLRATGPNFETRSHNIPIRPKGWLSLPYSLCSGYEKYARLSRASAHVNTLAAIGVTKFKICAFSRSYSMRVKLHVELPKSIKPFLSKGNLSDLADIALSVSFCCRSKLSMTEHLPYLRLQRVIWTIVFISVSACQAALCFMINPLNINDLRFLQSSFLFLHSDLQVLFQQPQFSP